MFHSLYTDNVGTLTFECVYSMAAVLSGILPTGGHIISAHSVRTHRQDVHTEHRHIEPVSNRQTKRFQFQHHQKRAYTDKYPFR